MTAARPRPRPRPRPNAAPDGRARSRARWSVTGHRSLVTGGTCALDAAAHPARHRDHASSATPPSRHPDPASAAPSLHRHPERASGASESKGLWLADLPRSRERLRRRQGLPQILRLRAPAARSAQDDEGRQTGCRPLLAQDDDRRGAVSPPGLAQDEGRATSLVRTDAISASHVAGRRGSTAGSRDTTDTDPRELEVTTR